MGIHHQAITNFSGGQVSPLMAGRVDSEAYPTMVDTLENMLVQRQGGIIRRMGTNFIYDAIADSTPSRMIPFEFSTTQAYILEFGDQKMHVFKDGGIVMDGASPYEVVTPWDETEVPDLKFVQSADTMFIVHPDFPPYEVTRTAHDAWTVTEVTPVWGPFLDENETAVTLTPSAVTGAGITVTASGATFNADHVGSYWQISGLKEETESCNAHEMWTSSLTVEAGETLIVSISGTWVATVSLQRSFDSGSTWLDYITYTANASTEIIEARDEVDYRIGIDTGDYTSGTAEVSIALPEKKGYFEITAYASTTSVTATVIEDLPSTDATTKWSEGAWSDYQGYPSAIAFHELRLVLSGTARRPETLWASEVDDFTSFKAGTADSNAWTYQLAAERVNVIHSLVTGEVLFILTAGGEWRLGNTSGEATTPTSVEVRRETAYGSLNTQATMVGHTVVFPHRSAKSLRMMIYNYRIDGWESHNISFFAEDLFADGIAEILVVDNPVDLIWIRMSTGELVACTYDLNQSTFAYSSHEIAGTSTVVESIATIPGDDYDEVWMCVKRYINGGWVRYIEQMATPFWTDVEDAIYLDSALTYSGAETTSISGLDHLEGESVALLVDGAAHPEKTVASGAVTLDYGGSVVQAGLGFTAKVKTLKLEARTPTGTSQTHAIDSVEVAVRLDKTVGMEVSTDDTNFDVYPFRDPADLMDTELPTFTGDTTQIELEPADDYRAMQLAFRNTQPLPFNILGIFPTLRTS